MPAHFAISWLMTWFSHDIEDFSTAQRVFDVCIASHPLMPVHLAAAVRIRTVMRCGHNMLMAPAAGARAPHSSAAVRVRIQRRVQVPDHPAACGRLRGRHCSRNRAAISVPAGRAAVRQRRAQQGACTAAEREARLPLTTRSLTQAPAPPHATTASICRWCAELPSATCVGVLPGQHHVVAGGGHGATRAAVQQRCVTCAASPVLTSIVGGVVFMLLGLSLWALVLVASNDVIAAMSPS